MNKPNMRMILSPIYGALWSDFADLHFRLSIRDGQSTEFHWMRGNELKDRFLYDKFVFACMRLLALGLF